MPTRRTHQPHSLLTLLFRTKARSTTLGTPLLLVLLSRILVRLAAALIRQFIAELTHHCPMRILLFQRRAQQHRTRTVAVAVISASRAICSGRGELVLRFVEVVDAIGVVLPELFVPEHVRSASGIEI